jgi:TctA family transporter
VIDGLVDALGVLFAWPNPLWIVGGVLFGMLIGFLPGMAGSVALALLIPVSFSMEPQAAVLFLIAAYSPSGFGGMLTSILVNTPGNPENAATTFDGYPMTRQGRAGAAIGAATAASVIGGLLGTILLLALIVPAKAFVLSFSYPEFLMMAVLGLTVIAVVTERNTYKGLIAAGVGFLIAFIGLDPITGAPRFTFDQLYLWDGIDIVPVLMGLFAGAEVLALFGKGATIVEEHDPAGEQARPEDADPDEPVTFWQGVRATFRHWFLVVRASVLGTVVGIIPGVGGAVSGFLAYSHAKQTSRRPDRFGRGAVEGVIAAESANDAKEGGSLVPTVAFGIPSTVGMAILLGALIMHGVPAGPTLMIDHSEVIYVLVIGMVAAKFIAPFVVWLVAGQARRLTTMRPGLFTPLIAVTALVGAYTIQFDMLDLVVTVIFGYVGYAMRRYGFSRIALIIALVLGELVERSYYQTTAAFGSPWAVLTRPISAILFAVAVLVIVFAVVQGVRRVRRRARAKAAGETLDEGPGMDSDEDAPSGPRPGRVLFTGLLLAFAVVIVGTAYSLSGDAATMPLIIGWPVSIALALQLAVDVVAIVRARRVSTPDASDEPVPSGGGVATVVAAPATTTTERTVLLRQAAFGLWVCGFVVLSYLVGFLIAIPVALMVFYLLLAREHPVRAALITAVTWAALYGLFDLVLGISLSW